MQDPGATNPCSRWQILRTFRDALAREAPSLVNEDLRSFPRLVWQQLSNRLAWAPGTQGLVRAHEARHGAGDHPWLRLENPIVESARLVTTIPLRGDIKLFSCDIAPDGRSIAIVAISRFAPLLGTHRSPGVLVLRLPDGLQIAQLTGHRPDAEGCAFSPAGDLLATSGDDGTVRIWRTRDYKCLTVLPHSEAEVYALAFSHDGGMLASGSTDGLVRIWSVGGDSPPLTWTAHDGPTMGCAFSPQSDRLATCGHDGVARIWTLDGLTHLELPGHDGWVTCLAFSPDGEWVATGGADAAVRLWEASTGRHVAVLEGHSDEVHSCRFSPDGSILASVSSDMDVRLWGVESRRCFATLTGHSNAVMGCRFAPDNPLLYTTAFDGTVRAWSLPPESATRTTDTRHHAGVIHECRFSKHAGWILTASLDKTMRTWKVGPLAPLAELAGHRHEVKAVSDSPDGQFALSVGYDGGVMVSECASGKTIARVAGVAPATSCDWSSAGDRAVIGWENGWVQMIDLFDPTRSWTVERYRAGVSCARFSADGHLLASAGGDGRVSVVYVDSIERLYEYHHDVPISHCEFFLGRDLLAVVDFKGGLTILDVTGSTLPLRTQAHRSVASSCAVQPHGNLLATCGFDGLLRLWKTDDLSLQGELIARGPLRSCDFDETGDMLCCSDTGGNLYVLQLEGRRAAERVPDAYANRALRRPTAALTGAATDATRESQQVTVDISRWSKPELTLLAQAPIATLMVVAGVLKASTKRTYSFDMTAFMEHPPGGRAHPNAFANAVFLEASGLVRSGNMSPRITLPSYASRVLEQVRDLVRSKATPLELTELREAVFLMCRSMLHNAGAPARFAEAMSRDVIRDFL